MIDAFLERTGWAGATRMPLAGDASARRYLRLIRGGDRAVLMIAPPAARAAFDAFLGIGKWLRDMGLSAPEIFASDAVNGLMLMEDFGDALISDLARDPAEEARIYPLAADLVAALDAAPPPDGLAAMSAKVMIAMLDPVFDTLPDRSGADDLRAGVAAAALPVLGAAFTGQMPVSLRDLHAGNLIWLPERKGLARLGILDFQDALLAPRGYDLASLVDDARRSLPPDLRSGLIHRVAAATGQDRGELTRQVDLLSLQRNLRILGIFRRLAQQEGKGRYAAYLGITAGHVSRAAKTAPKALRAAVLAVLEAHDLRVPAP